MYAVRSNTGRPFRRSGVTFAPRQWTLLEELTPEQEAESEPPLKSLLILPDVDGPHDARLGGLGVNTTEIGGEFEAVLTVGVDADALAELQAENSVIRDRNALVEAELNRLTAEVGELLPGEHPDDLKPRAGTWLEERRNWIAEIEQARKYIAEIEPLAQQSEALRAEIAQRDRQDALKALTVADLVAQAQAAGIVGAADMNKTELVGALLGG